MGDKNYYYTLSKEKSIEYPHKYIPPNSFLFISQSKPYPIKTLKISLAAFAILVPGPKIPATPSW